MSLGEIPPSTTAGPTKAKIFISYSRKDQDVADRLDAALKARGFATLIDRSDIYEFEDWRGRIQGLITQADTVIFVISPDALASDECQREVRFAASLNKRLAPVVYRLAEREPIPDELARLNFLYFDRDEVFDDALARLCEALETDIDWVHGTPRSVNRRGAGPRQAAPDRMGCCCARRRWRRRNSGSPRARAVPPPRPRKPGPLSSKAGGPPRAAAPSSPGLWQLASWSRSSSPVSPSGSAAWPLHRNNSPRSSATGLRPRNRSPKRSVTGHYSMYRASSRRGLSRRWLVAIQSWRPWPLAPHCQAPRRLPVALRAPPARRNV